MSCVAQDSLSTPKHLVTLLFLAPPAADEALGSAVALWVPVCGREADGLNGAAVAHGGAELQQGDVVFKRVSLEAWVHNDASDGSPGGVRTGLLKVVHPQNSPPAIWVPKGGINVVLAIKVQ